VYVGQRLADGLADTLLVLRMQEREQEADRDGLDLGLAQRGDDLGQRVLVERLQLAVGPHPLAHAEAQVAGHQRGRAAAREVVEVRPGLAADLQDVAEARRRHEGRARAAALQQRVGRHRHPVGERGDLRQPGRLDDRHDALGLVLRRRRDLRGHDTPADERGEVGERPAHIDAEGRAGHRRLAR
jgi:hypothetical protein